MPEETRNTNDVMGQVFYVCCNLPVADDVNVDEGKPRVVPKI